MPKPGRRRRSANPLDKRRGVTPPMHTQPPQSAPRQPAIPIEKGTLPLDQWFDVEQDRKGRVRISTDDPSTGYVVPTPRQAMDAMQSSRETERIARLCSHRGVREITRIEYDKIVSQPDEYQVVVDQIKRRCWKRSKNGMVNISENINKTYFALLQELVSSRRLFDLRIHGKALEGRAAPEQTLQRMRQTFDVKKGTKRTADWCLIKTCRTDDGRAAYQFDPDPHMTYAFIFLLSR
jgi:hypothetical protein